MKKVILTILTIITSSNSHTAFYFPMQANENMYSVQIAAMKGETNNPAARNRILSMMEHDAYLNQVITASVATVGITTCMAILIGILIEYIKQAPIREEKRKIELTRVRAELQRQQQEATSAA